MNSTILPLLSIAAVTGVVHTILGPDHYLPFIALSKAQSWSRTRTAWVTFLCGLGHILSSVVIAYMALGLRFSLGFLQTVDSARSDFAAWALIAFGFTYFIWGLKKLYKSKVQSEDLAAARTFSPVLWALFIIFVVGPCEPLFFLMTYPSLAQNPLAISLAVLVFGAATIATMMTAVLGASFGLSFVRGEKAARFAPAFGGVIIMACGIGIKFLGL